MPIINKETGSITYDNTAIKMQERIEGDELYSPLYPREVAANIQWNSNTLTLPKEVGNSTYETKYRALDYTYSGQYLFALKDCIYKYLPDTKTLNRVHYFYRELGDDYFVDISIRTGVTNSTFYLLSAQGKIYSFPADRWYDTKLDECTGIVYTNGKMLVSTNHGLYVSDWDNTQNFNFTQIQVADFALEESFSAIDVMTHQNKSKVLIVTSNNNIFGATSELTNPTVFTKLPNDVSNEFHGYKNIIPQLNLVVCKDGVWNVSDASKSQFNTSDLHNLKDTQYIYYIKKWSSSHYECSNNKWNMTIGYDGAGNITSSASYSDGSPMYVLFPETSANWCLTINNNGKAYHTIESGTTVSSTSCGSISLTTYRAPRYSYHNDLGTGSTQQIVKILDSKMAQEGRIFDEIPNIPFTFANYPDKDYATSEIVFNEDKTMGMLYRADTTDVFIYQNGFWKYTNILDKIPAGNSVNANMCWYNGRIWGLLNTSQANKVIIYSYNPTTDVTESWQITANTTDVSSLAGWSITVNSFGITFSTGWIYSQGEEEQVFNGGVYHAAKVTGAWQKVDTSQLADEQAVATLNTIILNNTVVVYGTSETGYDTARAKVFRLQSNTLRTVTTSSVLQKPTYRYVPFMTKGIRNEMETGIIPDAQGLLYTTDFSMTTRVSYTDTIDCRKVEYLPTHNKWIMYEGSTNILENNTISYPYAILNPTTLAVDFGNQVLDISAIQELNSVMSSSMTPWIYESQNDINVCFPNGIVAKYTYDSRGEIYYSSASQTYVQSSNIRLQKVVRGVDKYIMLYTYSNINNYIPKSSGVCYSDDGVNWYGGYNLSGYYTDMCYYAGQLWIGGFEGVDNNDIFTPAIVYSGALNSGNIDLINYGTFHDNSFSVSGRTGISGYYGSIAASGSTVCLATCLSNNTYISYVKISDNNDSLTSGSATKHIGVGFTTKIVAGATNVYYYVVNGTAQRYFYELKLSGLNWTVTQRGVYNVTTNMAGQVSDYDPVHDGVYITVNDRADIYTQGRVFHIGNIGSVTKANQVGWFHGRYLYNVLVGSTTKSAYGIVPWFNSYPHDCKYLSMVVKVLCPCEDKCFVISDNNKLYVSFAI